jgi:inorganic triphosphatase YgiF
LTLPSGTVDVAFDTGVVKSGERTVPICEIEIELKRGGPAAVYDFALLLTEHGAVRPATRSKAERGFDLAFETAPIVHGPRPLLPSGEVSLDDALTQLLRSALHQLLLNQPAAEAGRDPEGVHQLRIALRRLRCALNMLRPLAPVGDDRVAARRCKMARRKSRHSAQLGCFSRRDLARGGACLQQGRRL